MKPAGFAVDDFQKIPEAKIACDELLSCFLPYN